MKGGHFGCRCRFSPSHRRRIHYFSVALNCFNAKVPHTHTHTISHCVVMYLRIAYARAIQQHWGGILQIAIVFILVLRTHPKRRPNGTEESVYARADRRTKPTVNMFKRVKHLYFPCNPNQFNWVYFRSLKVSISKSEQLTIYLCIVSGSDVYFKQEVIDESCNLKSMPSGRPLQRNKTIMEAESPPFEPFFFSSNNSKQFN